MEYFILSMLLLFTPATKSEKSIRKNNNKDAPPGTVWIRDSLYMDYKEVSNVDYREYIFWQKRVKGKNSDTYINSLPDTLVWRNKLAYNEPFVSLYFRHPVYNKYPVVGISFEQANEYCKWRTDVVNEFIYKKINKIKIDQEVTDKEIPKYVCYRLPTKEEWDYAARGGLKESTYPWGGYYLTNYKGMSMAHYYGIGDEWIEYSDSLNQYIIQPYEKKYEGPGGSNITMPTESYLQNDYGLYDIVGNVAEMIDEKGISKGGSWRLPGYHCRIDQEWQYTKPANHVGFRCVCDKLMEW